MAILFLSRSKEGWHVTLFQYFKSYALNERDYYTTAISGIYDLMVQNSGQF